MKYSSRCEARGEHVNADERLERLLLVVNLKSFLNNRAARLQL